MKQSAGVLALLLALVAGGCDAFFGPEADAGPEESFEVLWREIDRHYAYFAEKGVAWDGVQATFRPRVTPRTTQRQLFDIATEMLALLRDGHVSLHAPGVGNWNYDGWFSGKPENYNELVVLATYLGGARVLLSGGHMYYGRLSAGIGYIRIRDFAGSGWAGEVDRALAALADAPALILDIRSNGGGSDALSEPIAGRFADRRRLAEVIRYRNGPAHDHFTGPIERYIEPAGPRHFTRPIALLTNRRAFSAAESFTASLSVLPHVTVIGDTTGGGGGNPIARELPNGWTFRVSRWQVRTADGFSYEGIGLAPDVTVWITALDAESGRDTIMERAIALLQQAMTLSSSAMSSRRTN